MSYFDMVNLVADDDTDKIIFGASDLPLGPASAQATPRARLQLHCKLGHRANIIGGTDKAAEHPTLLPCPKVPLSTPRRSMGGIAPMNIDQ